MSGLISHSGRLGPPQAPMVLYLPNPPLLPNGHPPADVPALIAHNGNHWRKILTILAKLGVPDADDWRRYRDQELLNRQEAISFNDRIDESARWHLVGGKASWERLGFDKEDFVPLDDSGTLFARDDILLTPYPDYRQFPNRSIERVREWLRLRKTCTPP